MATSFYRFARRSFPSSTVAAATATATVAAVTLSKSDKSNDDSNNVGIGAPNDGKRHGLGSSGIFPFGNKSQTFPLYSPVFSFMGKSVALCEAPPASTQPHQQPPQSNAPYKPSDPAEPVADPTVEVTGSDGKKVHVKGGMWGEDEDGLVSTNILSPYLMIITCVCIQVHRNNLFIHFVSSLPLHIIFSWQYHGLFPRRQLWRPRLEYPLWDHDWDGRRPPPITTQVGEGEVKNENDPQPMTEAQRDRYIRKKGVTKHIILIRHGQYDETSKVR